MATASRITSCCRRRSGTIMRRAPPGQGQGRGVWGRAPLGSAGRPCSHFRVAPRTPYCPRRAAHRCRGAAPANRPLPHSKSPPLSPCACGERRCSEGCMVRQSGVTASASCSQSGGQRARCRVAQRSLERVGQQARDVAQQGCLAHSGTSLQGKDARERQDRSSLRRSPPSTPCSPARQAATARSTRRAHQQQQGGRHRVLHLVPLRVLPGRQRRQHIQDQGARTCAW